MIPVKLKLSNFTSYGENIPQLDFTKFHLAAISGPNGAGKSSILDAITWCVWGWSRAGDNADQLVRLGADTMFVEFSFELDDHLYTVKRKRVTKSGGSSALELWSGSTSPSILKSSGLKGSPLHNLTEGTIKATQQKIINTLHLSYETFSNSAFLRQGHADEFTTKGPTDRKRILADILGLSHYDDLEEKAKEKSREVSSKLSLLEYQLLEIEAELSQKQEREKSLSVVEEEARKVEGELKQIEILIKTMEKEHNEIIQTVKSLQEKKLQLEQIQKELADIELQIKIKEKAQEEFQGILNQKEEIEKNYLILQQLTTDKKALETKRSELIKIKDELALTQKTLMAREEKRSQALTQIEIEIKKVQTESAAVQDQINHLKEHKDTCPTCGQTINEAKNKEILTEDEKKMAQYLSQIKDLEEKLTKYKAAILPEAKEVERLETQVKKREEETKDWTEVNQQISSLEKYTDLQSKLQQAEVGIKAHSGAILDLQKMYQQKQEQITTSQTELAQLQDFESKLQEIKNKLAAQETIKQELSQKTLELRGKVGEAKQLVSRAVQLEDLHQKKVGEKTDLQKEKDAYEELALAFGKKGIQTMIIETAIPEIEDEANRLLDKLSEGRMKITLITQKETKTKVAGERGVVETLDIVISDEMGERPYELYSGGEAFRVNIAIRLALSKLLTRRAGAKLQFLVIDEGFGTQDAQGRTRIVEVIDTIKDDFEKILAITHLDELKEEFPVRIEVSKNSASSTFEVVGV